MMTQSEAKRIIAVNAAFWLVAMLLHPVLRLVPSSSGNPAKIFELLVPLVFILLASVLKAAIGQTKKED